MHTVLWGEWPPLSRVMLSVSFIEKVALCFGVDTSSLNFFFFKIHVCILLCSLLPCWLAVWVAMLVVAVLVAMVITCSELHTGRLTHVDYTDFNCGASPSAVSLKWRTSCHSMSCLDLIIATEKLDDNFVLAGVIPVGISAQISIQELYDSCTWTLSDCGSYSGVMPNSVETNVHFPNYHNTCLSRSVSGAQHMKCFTDVTNCYVPLKTISFITCNLPYNLNDIE